MKRTLGNLLETLRRTAGVSRAEGATRSGVSRMTLFRWERGDNLPRDYELRAVLNAYGASHQHRRAIHAAREGEALQRLTQSGRRLPPPQTHLGDLLAALRGRAKLTQVEVAARANVPRFALSSWENLHAWPDDATLHRLACALNATENELLALTAPPNQRNTDDDRSLDALYHEANWMTWGWPPLDQSEPEMLRLMARLRELAPQEREARRLLMNLEYGYAVLLTHALRPQEAARRLKRADADMPDDPTSDDRVWPIYARARVEQEALRHAPPVRRRRVLQQRWERQRAVNDAIEGVAPVWIIAHRMEMAFTVQQLGDDDSGLHLAQSAFALTERNEGTQPEMRLWRYGALLHAAHRHDKIADLFPAYLGRNASADVHIRYYLGLAARAHGDEPAADALLRQALTDAQAQGRPSLERDIRQSLLGFRDEG